MDKLKMQTANKADDNFRALAAMFPNAVTEAIDENGEVVRAIDKDVLMQEISVKVVEGKEERYQFTWPDKKKSVLLANAPISKTLRPCRGESVDFDTTENLYIEGDNLEVLKLLQETYLGKIKMIYIDPPYNTGNDFVYEDNFAQSTDEYMEHSGQFDDEGNRLVKNLDSNGRFHTDWLNMIYPRLRVAKDLLRADGVIFISIDDNEVAQLKKMCDEIFGADNYEGLISWRRRHNQPNDKTKMIAKVSEYIVVYSKNSKHLTESGAFHGIPFSDERIADYRNPDDDPNGRWISNPWKAATGRGGTFYTITTPSGKEYSQTWYGNEKTFVDLVEKKRVHWTNNGEGLPRIKVYLNEAQKEGQAAIDWFPHEKYGSNQEGSSELDKLFNAKGLFDNPKPLKLIISFAMLSSESDSIILDFFSGSSTTAHAVMQLNAEDGGKRKFIMVQWPEKTDEKSEAYKAGYKNICEIGKERIRRAGKKIKEESPLTTADLDVGFRVLKCDISNMKEVFYKPDEVAQATFDNYTSNIKEERTPEDLLFQVMLDLGVLLSSKIEETTINDCKVFNVADGFLYACFDNNISDDVVTTIAKQQPYYAVFRDSGMASDSVMTNFDQIFASISPSTVRKVL